MNYKVPEETLNEILAYLGEKPYKEVSQLVSKIYITAEREIDLGELESTELKQAQGHK